MRLDVPVTCPKNISELMVSCWDIDPDERPTFTEIKKFLREEINLIEQQRGHMNMADSVYLTAPPSPQEILHYSTIVFPTEGTRKLFNEIRMSNPRYSNVDVHHQSEGNLNAAQLTNTQSAQINVEQNFLHPGPFTKQSTMRRSPCSEQPPKIVYDVMDPVKTAVFNEMRRDKMKEYEENLNASNEK